MGRFGAFFVTGDVSIRRRVEIGLLYSRSGSYRQMSEACRAGALAAIRAVNGDPAMPLILSPVERDPAGDADRYAPLCADLLASSGARHVVGCITSSSRKEVIPVLEKAGATLWYACPYEGFEASDRVIYTHAAPNQHLLPLLDWAMARFGRRGFLTGSNYIWGWEMNRIAREVLEAAGGEVLAERYLAVGDEDVERMVAEIGVARPDFVLNNLIGASSYAFLRAFADLAARDPWFRPERCPVLSCNLTECELDALGPAAEGLVSAGPFFDGAGGWPGIGHGASASSYEAAAHASVLALAALLAEGGNDTAAPRALLARPVARRLGIDPATHHVRLPVLIAQVRQGRFDVLHRQPPVAADPYLAGRAPAPALRVVG